MQENSQIGTYRLTILEPKMDDLGDISAKDVVEDANGLVILRNREFNFT